MTKTRPAASRAADCGEEAMPDPAPDWEWYRELAEDWQAAAQGGAP